MAKKKKQLKKADNAQNKPQNDGRRKTRMQPQRKVKYKQFVFEE